MSNKGALTQPVISRPTKAGIVIIYIVSQQLKPSAASKSLGFYLRFPSRRLAAKIAAVMRGGGEKELHSHEGDN